MKVSFLTLGCRVNQSESSAIEGTLVQHGARIVDLDDNPDYCIVNTCSVTAKSDYNSRQLIRRAARAGAKVIVTGCYSQLSRDAVMKMPGVLTIVDNDRKDEIASLIDTAATEMYFGHHNRSRPHLKIQDGCNHRCSYCSVPIARGRSRSVPPADVLERVLLAASKGYKEVVLTGIHLGTYGYDLAEKTSLARLVALVLRESSIHRIRLSSLEVGEVGDDLIELFQDARLCGHLHLPLQSGSDRILLRMKRLYSSKEFARKVELIAGKIENIALGTDIIVGFPGEEEHDFLATVSLVEELPLSSAFLS